mmetsp:Transcript_50791/g.143049  ORF Transcript_50791/g.143049 Transcript_50791/m.143049 type:complete len:111 (-) Transcript_50791:134-466(-)
MEHVPPASQTMDAAGDSAGLARLPWGEEEDAGCGPGDLLRTAGGLPQERPGSPRVARAGEVPAERLPGSLPLRAFRSLAAALLELLRGALRLCERSEAGPDADAGVAKLV